LYEQRTTVTIKRCIPGDWTGDRLGPKDGKQVIDPKSKRMRKWSGTLTGRVGSQSIHHPEGDRPWLNMR
jgi:hypothetical protein